jgi:hypothetical protein
VTGIYAMDANVTWATSPADGTARRVTIRPNGAASLSDVNNIDTSSVVRLSQSLSRIARLNAGDYIELVVGTGSAQPVDVVPFGNLSPGLELAFISPAG